jgi:hypothetical protein
MGNQPTVLNTQSFNVLCIHLGNVQPLSDLNLTCIRQLGKACLHRSQGEFETMRWKAPTNPSTTAYNPEDVVRGLTDYYHLLTQAGYLSPTDIKHPPPGGWTDADLAIEALSGLGFTDAVIQLYRRISYVPKYDIQIWPDTRCLSWLKDNEGTHDEWLDDYKKRGIAPVPQPFKKMPSSMATLSFGEGANGTPWVVDTENGMSATHLLKHN